MRVQITRTGIRVPRLPRGVEPLRREFQREDFVRIPRILEPSLLEVVCREVEQSEFYERVHEGIGDNRELCMRNRSTAGGLLHLLLNSEELFEVVSEIARCGSIGCFSGRVYRVVPGCGHHDAWHSDIAEHRLVAMSINLSRGVYRGGVLQMRARGSRRIRRHIPNTGFGDAILFRISPDLEHRITDVEGTQVKTAFAGWFQAEPAFRAMMGLGSRVTA